VSLHDVTVAYRKSPRPSVSLLSLTIEPGQVFGLLGPNGSGKTTTINVITGLLAASAGTARVFGLPPERARRRMGVVTQETSLYGALSVRFNLGFSAWLWGYHGQDRRQRVEEALRMANLPGSPRQRAGKLSGGQARRVAIAREFMHQPDLLILDEPSLGVDPHERAALWDNIRALARVGRTVLLTTNVMEEADALCDTVAIMRAGRLATEPDTPANLQRRYGGTVVTVAASGNPAGVLAAVAELRDNTGITGAAAAPSTGPGEHEITVSAAAEDYPAGLVTMALATRGVTVVDVSVRRASLSEVFLHLTGPNPVQA